MRFWVPLSFSRIAHLSRKCAAGAVAANRDTVRIDAKFGRMRLNPLDSRNRIVQCGRKFMLRRAAIIDCDHAKSALIRELAA